MDSKDPILEFLEEQLLDQRQDYETVKLQLRTELDGPTQNRLKRKLDLIALKIEKLGKEIKDREQEHKEKAGGDALDRLMEILQRPDAQLDEMRGPYRAVVHARSINGLSDNVETVESLTTELSRIPLGGLNYTALEEFAARLVRTSKNKSLIISLQSWGEQYCSKHWSKLLEQLGRQQTEREQNVQTALLIVISPSDESTPQSYNGEEKYRLQVWMIEDIEKYKADRQGYEAIGLETDSELTGDETYSERDISIRLQQIFKKRNVFTELSKKSEVHFFLPQQLLNCDADSWRLIDLNSSNIPIGCHCQVFIRLYERLSRSHNPKKWRGKWQQKKSLFQQKAFNVFIKCDDYGNSFYFDLTEEEENMVGLKLVKAPTQDCLTSIFNAIFKMGFPLAIWGRTNLSEATNETELDRVLETDLSNLPQTVRKERRRSHKESIHGHIGHHLSLLWDDPDLVPPKSA